MTLDYLKGQLGAGEPDPDEADELDDSSGDEYEPDEPATESDDAGNSEPDEFLERWTSWYADLTDEGREAVASDPNGGALAFEEWAARQKAGEGQPAEQPADPDVLAWWASLTPGQRAAVGTSHDHGEGMYREFAAAAEALGFVTTNMTDDQAEYVGKVLRRDHTVPLRLDDQGVAYATPQEMGRLSAPGQYEAYVRDAWRQQGLEQPTEAAETKAALEARLRGERVRNPTGEAPDLWGTMPDAAKVEAVNASFRERMARNAARRAR
jgi:hypothetical protein